MLLIIFLMWWGGALSQRCCEIDGGENGTKPCRKLCNEPLSEGDPVWQAVWRIICGMPAQLHASLVKGDEAWVAWPLPFEPPSHRTADRARFLDPLRPSTTSPFRPPPPVEAAARQAPCSETITTTIPSHCARIPRGTLLHWTSLEKSTC